MSLATSIAGEFNDLHLLSTNSIGASSPNSGFVNEPEFIFKEEAGLEYKTVIDEGYVKIGNKAYSTSSENLITSDPLTLSGDTTIDGSLVKFGGSTSNAVAYQPVGTTSGLMYVIDFTISDYVSGGIQGRIGNVRGSDIRTSNGNHRVFVLSDGQSFIGVETEPTFQGIVSLNSVKALSSIDFTGTLPDVTVVDGLGAELVDNGMFHDSSTWTLDTGLSIVNGQLYANNVSAEAVSNTFQVVTGAVYRISYQIAESTSGNARVLVRQLDGTVIGDQPTGTNAGVGTYTYTFTSNFSGAVNARVEFPVTTNIRIDNVSVKEVIDNYYEVSASKGDYFIDDIEHSTSSSETFTVASGTEFIDISLANMINGAEYVASMDVVTDGLTGFASMGGMIGDNARTSVSGRIFTKFTYDSSLSSGLIEVFAVDGVTSTLSNITVKSNDNLKQASRDIADMLDYSLELGKQLTVKDREVVFADGSIFPVLSSGEGFYQNIKGTSIAFTPSSLTSIGAPSWRYLGTASEMSLQNPYFVDREAITNQVLAYIEEAADNTISTKTEVLMELSYAVETPIQILTKNGFTHLGKGLFSKNGLNVIPIGIWQTKNEYAYHPVYNVMGTRGVQQDNNQDSVRQWHDNNALIISSIEDCWLNLSSNTSYGTGLVSSNGNKDFGGSLIRPDGKFYDVVYGNDFIPMYNKASQTANTELVDRFLNDAIGNKLSGVNNMSTTLNVLNAPLTDVSESTATLIDGEVVNRTVLGFDNSVIGSFEDSVDYARGRGYCGGNSKRHGVIRWDISGTSTYVQVDGHVASDFTVSSTYSASRIEDLPILSRGTQSRIDVIGSPLNYPQDWKDELTRGKSLLFNPLLVNQDGSSAIPDGTSKDFMYSKKSTSPSLGDGLYTGNSGETWASSGFAFSQKVSNKVTIALSTVNVFVQSYTAVNDMVLRSDPKASATVNSKVVASNSHSSHIVNACLGKVAVGNLSNGLESKVLENVVTYVTPEWKWTTLTGNGNNITTGDIFLNAPLSTHPTESGELNGVYKRIGNPFTASGTAYDYANLVNWEYLGNVISVTTPKHDTLTLNKAVSPTCKYFVSIAEQDGYKYGMVYAKEMVWDSNRDSVSDVNDITAGVPYSRTDGELIRLNGFDNSVVNGVIFRNTTTSSGTWGANTFDGYYVRDGVLYSTGGVYAISWDGTGFGDNGEFDQLTNGADTDLNGSTITTFVGAFRLNELGDI